MSTISQHEKQPWQPTAEQQAFIDYIVAWQTAEGVDDTELASHTKNEETGRGRDSSTWHKIRRGKYPGKNNGAQILRDFQKGMENCVAYRAFVAAAPKDKFHAPKWYDAFAKLVSIAETREGLESEERLVTLVGRTAMGKSRASKELIRANQRGRMVHAMPSWKTGYKSILWSICDAFGLHAKGTAAEMERVVLNEFRHTRHTLYLCELSRFNVSPKLVELLLLLLNETRVALVLAINPEGFDHLLYLYDSRVRNRQLSDGSAQFLRRGRVLGANKVDVEVATAFMEAQFPGHQANGEIAALLAAEGSDLGGVSLVKEVVSQLNDAVTKRAAALSKDLAASLVNTYKGRWQSPCKPVAKVVKGAQLRAA